MCFNPYQHYAERYDMWFIENQAAYAAELRALCSLLPIVPHPSIEVGAGTGRFTVPLGIKVGIEPVKSMGKIAQNRGVQIIQSLAEALPLRDSSVHTVVMITVICFLQDVLQAFHEAYRVLTKGGSLMVAILDRKSPLGEMYASQKNHSLFYQQASFYSVDEVISLLHRSGFASFAFRQTIFTHPAQITQDEPVLFGHGQGLFAVIQGIKK
jgi:ubiquinone/menaquinone biosynthesis C-methylase UbiE